MVTSWQSEADPMDVNNDQVVSPLDALGFANEWGRTGPGPLDASAGDADLPMMYVDVDGDGALTEQDFDALVAYLDKPRQPSNAMGYVMGEGEGSSSGSGSGGETDVSFSIVPVPGSWVDESDGSVTLRVTPSGTAPYGASASWWGESGTAVAGEDFGSGSGSGSGAGSTLNFTAEEVSNGTSKDFTVDIVDDDVVELDEQFNVYLSWDDDHGNHDTNTTVGITDNDQATVDVSDSPCGSGGAPLCQTIAQENDLMYFWISLTKPVDVNVTVEYKTQDDSAEASEGDYREVTLETKTIQAGQMGAYISVQTYADSIVETDETFKVLLTGLQVSGRDVQPGDSEGVGTIVDTDRSDITIDDTTGLEGSRVPPDPHTHPREFTVTLSRKVDTTVVVSYQTTDDTATSAQDYVSKTSTVTFAPEQQSKPLFIDIIESDIVERDEQFKVLLTGVSFPDDPTGDWGSYISITDTEGVGTIENDDAATLSLVPVAPAPGEGDTGTVNIFLAPTLSQPCDVPVTFDVQAIVPESGWH